MTLLFFLANKPPSSDTRHVSEEVFEIMTPAPVAV